MTSTPEAGSMVNALACGIRIPISGGCTVCCSVDNECCPREGVDDAPERSVVVHISIYLLLGEIGNRVWGSWCPDNPGRAGVRGEQERFKPAHGSAKIGDCSGRTPLPGLSPGKPACRGEAQPAIILRFSQNIFRRSAYPSIQFPDLPIHVPCANSQADLAGGCPGPAQRR